ncbi:MAG: ferredoxin--NADP reductase [Dissulfurispiraceae bacterium]|jgi:glycine betaine catabolism B
MRIHLKERRPETTDVMSFTFDLDGQQLEYRPGQILHYELDALAFPDERGTRRHFTISSSPSEEGIVTFTTRIRGSGFKETLRQAPIGYELTCEDPEGEFILRQGEARLRHVFIAGGIGITPYRSMLRYAMDKDEPLNVLMLYFSHSSSDIIFKRELENIAGRMPTFSLVNVLTEHEEGWKGEQGKLDEAMLRKWVPDAERVFFWLSGPPSMVSAYRELFELVGIKEQSIRSERFMGY